MGEKWERKGPEKEMDCWNIEGTCENEDTDFMFRGKGPPKRTLE